MKSFLKITAILGFIFLSHCGAGTNFNLQEFAPTEQFGTETGNPGSNEGPNFGTETGNSEPITKKPLAEWQKANLVPICEYLLFCAPSEQLTLLSCQAEVVTERNYQSDRGNLVPDQYNTELCESSLVESNCSELLYGNGNLNWVRNNYQYLPVTCSGLIFPAESGNPIIQGSGERIGEPVSQVSDELQEAFQIIKQNQPIDISATFQPKIGTRLPIEE